jgi:hypothetical protein
MNMRTLQRRHDQSGLVSIIVVTVIIVILSLVTIGFTKIMSRELSQSLDRELASQANYAAESGLNDAKAYIKDAIANHQDPSSPPGQCTNVNAHPNFFVTDGSVSGHYGGPASTVRYTCIIIDTQPPEVTTSIPVGQSKVFKVVPNPGINSMYFGWQNSQYAGTPATPLPLPGTPAALAAHLLPKESAFTGTCAANCTGMIRVTIYPIDQSLTTNPQNSDAINANLANRSHTYFMYSNNSGAPATAASIGATMTSYAANGTFINGNCNGANQNSTVYFPDKQGTGRYCDGGINNLPAPGATPFYYVRITALYQNMDVTMQASDGSNPTGNVAKLGQAQATIDVTAEGSSVLKRLKYALALNPNFDYPNYALQSMDTICKRLREDKTGPNSFDFGQVDDNPDLVSSNDLKAACQPAS